MKKFFLFTVLALFFGAFATPRAEAQNYAVRVIGVCPTTHQNIYAQYRPVNYNGCVRYAWVPIRHNPVQRRVTSYTTRYHRGTPYNYVTPRYPVHYNRGYSAGYNTGGCGVHAGYVRPGFSITIRR